MSFVKVGSSCLHAWMIQLTLQNASILCVLLALFIDNVGYCFVVPFLPQVSHATGDHFEESPNTC